MKVANIKKDRRGAAVYVDRSLKHHNRTHSLVLRDFIDSGGSNNVSTGQLLQHN